LGDPEALDRAIEYLARVEHADQRPTPEDFVVEELMVNAVPGWAGRTLADLELRSRCGVSVLAVARDHERLEPPDPHRPLGEHDRLVLAGAREEIERVRNARHARQNESTRERS